jgi:hypothetical protein
MIVNLVTNTFESRIATTYNDQLLANILALVEIFIFG